MVFEVITTERLKLRKLTQEVYDDLFDNYSKENIKFFLGIDSDAGFEKEKEKYEKGLSTFNKSFIIFQLLNRENGQIIGMCGFHTWYLDHHRAEIGYKITDESLKGRGIMTEALGSVIDYGFRKMGLFRIEALVGPENKASIGLLKKFNFMLEGKLRKSYHSSNSVEDSLVFSLLKEEYENVGEKKAV
jgi:ribosomal-protein-alanine N-acetyltransferase